MCSDKKNPKTHILTLNFLRICKLVLDLISAARDRCGGSGVHTYIYIAIGVLYLKQGTRMPRISAPVCILTCSNAFPADWCSICVKPTIMRTRFSHRWETKNNNERFKRQRSITSILAAPDEQLSVMSGKTRVFLHTRHYYNANQLRGWVRYFSSIYGRASTLIRPPWSSIFLSCAYIPFLHISYSFFIIILMASFSCFTPAIPMRDTHIRGI